MINIYLLIFTISLKGIITYFTEGEKEVTREEKIERQKYKSGVQDTSQSWK